MWQFPDGERSIFSFRVDTDFGTHSQLNNLHSLFNENGISATWFVETKSIENNDDIKNLYKGFDKSRN